ncbi:MAG TPA: transaldolase family protein, partial [Trueperaceae bacterium]|nr:transaldolase family protein [Trueperaceae bacterium]
MNPLLRLRQFGQTVYLDEFRRSWLTNGRLQALIDDDGLAGVTSNPAIFQKAIVESHDYDEAIAELAKGGSTPYLAYEELTVADIRAAADLFRPMYDASNGVDGFVSLEVSPHLANDEEGTVA